MSASADFGAENLRATPSIGTPSAPCWPATRSIVDRNTEIRATRRLESHPHFRGRCQWIRCDCHHRHLVLSGLVPSFYLKQLAQETLRGLDGIDSIENRIVVASPLSEPGDGSAP